MSHQIYGGSIATSTLKKGFRIHLLIFLLITPIIWLVWYFTDSNYLWPLWCTPGWAIGILFHYLGVFVFRKSKY